MKKNPCIAWVALGLMMLLSCVAKAELIKMSWTVDGVEREAMVSLPPSGGEKAPVLFFFHGHGGNMNGPSRNLAFQKLWPEAIVVYPQGLPLKTTVDPEGTKPGWQRSPGEVGDRDLKFFDAMLESLRSKHSVNGRRIYASGFSNGAIFTYLLWSERAKVLAAVAPCSGLTMPGDHLEIPRPALVVSGEKDPLVKIENARKVIETIKKLNNCAEEGKPWLVEGAVLYPSEKHVPLVTFIHPGAHVLPQGANEMIVKFFKLHELAE